MGQNQQIAESTGMYRCTGLGRTAFQKKGEALPLCPCSGGNCTWELRKEYNIDTKNPIVIILVIKDIGGLYTIQTDELPRVGHFLNIRGDSDNRRLDGRYLVIRFSTMTWNNEEYFYIYIEKVAEISDDAPVHYATPMNR